MIIDNEIKIRNLRAMIAAEEDPRTGGCGALLHHWADNCRPVQLDTKALKVLLKHYEIEDTPFARYGDGPSPEEIKTSTKHVRLDTTDLQRMVIALIAYSAELSVKLKKPDVAAEVDRLIDIVAQWNWLVSEANDWAVDITVKG